MSKTLVIAEKPSVAQDIVRALTTPKGKFEKFDDYFESDAFVVTSAVGHLLEIKAPEEFEVKRGKWSFAHLPVIPPHFDLKPVDRTKARLSAVVKLVKRKDIASLVNACDAGREGELIFRLIEQFATTKKDAKKPVKRLWLQSMTPQAIRDGFDNLRSEQQMQGLADAARSRSEADWLVGINGTRAFTAFNSRDGGFFLTTVGRVQTPTLSVVVEREEQIRKFVSRDFWEIHANFEVQAGQYTAKWINPAHKRDENDAEKKDNRVWSEQEARDVAQAVLEQSGLVTDVSKPTTQAAPALFDLTSLQKEANGRFGYSAKTTLSLAQSLYERHKALTYPRTDSKHLPEDYLPTVKQTFGMLAESSMKHLSPFAQMALKNNYVKPSKRVFDNSKVSDHFAIIPTLEEPKGLSEAEQKIYDLVVKRFMAIFFPSAEFLVTTRITKVSSKGKTHHFKTDGKVMVNPGWMTIYGKEATEEDDTDKTLVKVNAAEQALVVQAQPKPLKTRPPARYTEATLLGAMEGAGKLVEDDEFKEAMQEKGLGTPATRAAIIEGLLNEKYMIRDAKELIPMAKAFQLMTLLRGLGIEELSKPELTGEWEHKLSLIEHGKLSRESFMQEIAQMTEHIVKKAKEYDRDTVPGDYATLSTPCPKCSGQVKENYRRYTCQGSDGQSAGCGFSFGKTPAGRAFELAEVESFLVNKKIGPLDGFRSKAGWPFAAEMVLKFNEEEDNWKLEFDFGDDKSEESGELHDFSALSPLGLCPACGARVFELGAQYVCEKAVPTLEQASSTCKFKTGKMVLQQPIELEQIQKLLQTGKTDLLDKFVSMRTRRAFKAFLAWDAEAQKVSFQFEERASKYPARKTAAFAKKGAKKTPVAKKVGTKTAKAPTRKTSAAPRKVTSNLMPSQALAQVIGEDLVARTQAVKKVWDYIKLAALQDAKDKRAILCDDKLKAVFGKDKVTMFEITGLLSSHLNKVS